MEKQFINLQPRKWKEIYNIYISIADKTPEEREKAVQDYFESAGFTPEEAVSLTTSLIKTFSPELHNTFIENADEDEAKLSLQDIKLLKEKLLHEPSEDIRHLLVAFLVYARFNPHPSFWIKNDRKVINYLASVDKLKVSEQNLLTMRLHTLYNLDMQVVGSNQLIPCFRISWQAEQSPADTPDNPLVLLGPLNPATIKSFVKQIPYEEEVQPTNE